MMASISTPNAKAAQTVGERNFNPAIPVEMRRRPRAPAAWAGAAALHHFAQRGFFPATPPAGKSA